ncbi:putative regulatory protein [Streptomyces sp. NBRC 110611]|uniref:DUF397 domain-containing protein n=1 Tax=Streptomyces sp. NBRC 110611 TaxID=1621259 RepID=UPI00082B5FC4|nr:DUF397 domain-containing protein [Streptomyces sp. NBRC 110611]GAU68987.1 putative regulatory protein [Streptomyces sp. NBRC 110611]
MDRIRIYNGMPAKELGSEGWHKPWSGGNGGECVEAMRLWDGRIALRQSTDPDGPALIYTHHEMVSFIEGAKAGHADFLLAAAPGRCAERSTA